LAANETVQVAPLNWRYAVDRLARRCKWFMHKLMEFANRYIPQEIAMYGKRAQDNAPATHFRCDRVCRVNGDLYFSTRENTLEGPFENPEKLAREVQAYIERMLVLRMSL
jgi:hypothetical protein